VGHDVGAVDAELVEDGADVAGLRPLVAGVAEAAATRRKKDKTVADILGSLAWGDGHPGSRTLAGCRGASLGLHWS
jgi:hypothetical protein